MFGCLSFWTAVYHHVRGLFFTITALPRRGWRGVKKAGKDKAFAV
jgi:hypothetical protein